MLESDVVIFGWISREDFLDVPKMVEKDWKGETFFAVKRKAVPGRAMEGNFPQRAGKKI